MNDLEFRSFVLERLAGIVGYVDGYIHCCEIDPTIEGDEELDPTLQDIREIQMRLKEFQGEVRSHANEKEETRCCSSPSFEAVNPNPYDPFKGTVLGQQQ